LPRPHGPGARRLLAPPGPARLRTPPHGKTPHCKPKPLPAPAKRERPPEKNEKAGDKERRDKEFAERVKKIEERLPKEKMLSQYVLLIPKSKLEDTLKKRAELLEQKEQKK